MFDKTLNIRWTLTSLATPFVIGIFGMSPFSFFAGIRSLLFFTFVHIPLHTGDKFALRAAFSCFYGFQSHTLATLHYYDSTDCSAFHALAILKTFEIRPGGLLSHVFTGSIDIKLYASIHFMSIDPSNHNNITSIIEITTLN